jgi:hypothetical protein
MASAHRNLYREYLRILRVWPKQPNRQHRFDIYLERRKEEFRKFPVEIKEKEVHALRQLVQGELEQRYSTADSRLKEMLPGAQTYTLLDQPGQKELEVKRSPLKMLLSIITGQEKLRKE